jgi:hypothetical protein
MTFRRRAQMSASLQQICARLHEANVTERVQTDLKKSVSRAWLLGLTPAPESTIATRKALERYFAPVRCRVFLLYCDAAKGQSVFAGADTSTNWFGNMEWEVGDWRARCR